MFQLLHHLVEPSFQGVNRLFFSAFENDVQRTRDYNVMIDGRNCFNKTVKNNKITYENIRKIATG